MSTRVALHGLSASLVKARKVHWCIDQRAHPVQCKHRIEPGETYVRSVMFPNHDVYSYVDPVTHRPSRRPVAHDLCLSCASNYDDIGEIARTALTTTEGTAS